MPSFLLPPDSSADTRSIQHYQISYISRGPEAWYSLLSRNGSGKGNENDSRFHFLSMYELLVALKRDGDWSSYFFTAWYKYLIRCMARKEVKSGIGRTPNFISYQIRARGLANATSSSSDCVPHLDLPRPLFLSSRVLNKQEGETAYLGARLLYSACQRWRGWVNVPEALDV